MRFGQLLKQYINDSETSVRLFSKITDLNRGWLYNIFLGKKKLPEDKFHKMLDYFPFSDIQKELLRDSYYEEIYGTENYKKIQFIISELKALKLHDNSNYIFPKHIQTYNTNINYLTDSEQLLNSIIYILNASSKKSSPVTYTNFSFEQEDVDNIIYSCLLQNNDMQIFHIINFDNIGSDIHNLRNLFRSIKYACNKANTYFYYDNNHPLQLDNIFPFFIVTNSGVVLYNKSLNNGLLILDTSVVKELIKKAESILIQCTPLAFFPDDVFALKEYLTQNIEHAFESSIGPEPCLTKYLTLDILENIAKDSISDKKFVINSYYEWIKLTEAQSPSLLHLNTLEGFSNFAQEGRIGYFPTKFASPLSAQDRIKILKKCIEDNEKNQSFYLIDNNRISLPENIHIELIPPYTTLIYGRFDKSENPYMGEFIILLCSNTLLSDFTNFKDYVLRNKFYLNDKYTQLLFNDLILKLETEKTE